MSAICLLSLLQILTMSQVLARPLPRPTRQQLAWQNGEIGMFLHFAPNTWQDTEYDNLSTPLQDINPAKLDTDQWASTAKSMGAKYLVFVAKHVGGFCWWQTATTDYSVKNTPWRNGKGDVMADLQKSCRKYGLKLGVYLSPADGKLGIGVGGRAMDPSKQAQYQSLYRTQLRELLSRYGPIAEVWFDGSLIFDVSDLLHRYAPNAVVFQGPSASIRWVGNEDGIAPYPCWNGVKYDPKTWGTLTGADGNPDGDRWLPVETDCRMRDTWFWNTTNEPTVKSLADLMQIYESSVGRGTVLILNNTPDRSGLIPPPDVSRARDFGEEIRRRYGAPLAQSRGRGDVRLAPGTVIDAVSTMEDISQGERVREYTIEGFVNGTWVQLASGTSIGHKKIDKFTPVAVSKVRIRVLKSVGEPRFRNLAVYHTSAA